MRSFYLSIPLRTVLLHRAVTETTRHHRPATLCVLEHLEQMPIDHTCTVSSGDHRMPLADLRSRLLCRVLVGGETTECPRGGGVLALVRCGGKRNPACGAETRRKPVLRREVLPVRACQRPMSAALSCRQLYGIASTVRRTQLQCSDEHRCVRCKKTTLRP